MQVKISSQVIIKTLRVNDYNIMIMGFANYIL